MPHLRNACLSLVVLAVALDGAAPAQAAAPAVIAGPVQAGLVEGRSPCGVPGARPRLRQDWLEPSPGTQLCRVSIEILDDERNVLGSTVIRDTPHCSPAYLVCGPDGGGIVAMTDADTVTSWTLQKLSPAGTLDGEPVVVEPDPRCDLPDAWILTPAGELLGADDCRTYDTQSVVLRRFPLEGGPEPEPVWLRPASSVWVASIAADTDDLGQTIVAWAELSDNGKDDYDSHLFARAVDANGAPAGDTLPLGGNASEWLYDARAESKGVFSVTAWSYIATGPVRYTVSIDPDVFTAPTTTTTTLPPSPDAPAFERIRTVGPSGPPPGEARLAEGSLVSMVGSGSGQLLLRRTLLQRDYDGRFYSQGLSPSWGHVSTDAGARWRRADGVPQPVPYEPFDEAAAANGTMLTATIGWYNADDDGEGYWGTVLTVDVRRSTDGGVTWSDRAIAAKVPHGDDFYMQAISLAGDGHGTWLAAFASSRQINGGSLETWKTVIDVAWSYDDGRTWVAGLRASEEVVETESYDIGDALRPLVTATSAAGGSWGLAWRSERNGALWVARASDSSSAWQAQQLRPAFERPANVDPGDWSDFATPYGRPALATTPSGSWIVAWQEEHLPSELGWDSDIFLSRSGDDGVHWSAPEPLGAYAEVDAAVEAEPSLAVGSDGRVLAVWSSHDPLGGEAGLDADIVSSISSDGGSSWTPPALVDAAARGDDRQDRSPVAIASGDGTWTVAWTTFPYSARWEWDQDDTAVKVAISGSRCGNGAVDAGEECDDGNAADGDGCNGNCTLPGCGNEVLDDGEDCDFDDPESGPACTPVCEASICGDGFQNIWTEQCDDGNSVDTDSCTSLCRVARCGDGFTRIGEEACDDGNYVVDDACNNQCEAAYCGDGFVLAGVEACDDGDGWSGNACTDLCEPARCGDGRVWLGVEQCDDPDGSELGGKCTPDCRSTEPCSDADASGLTTASDALTILRTAVALADACTPDRCDVNGSGDITAVDASGALRTSAGLEVELACPVAGLASFVLDASPLLGALQFEVRFDGTGIGFGLGDGKAHCEVRVPAAMSASWVQDSGTLGMGILSIAGFQGPIELARCPVYARRGESGGGGGVEIVVVDASDPEGNSVAPVPQVRLVTH